MPHLCAFSILETSKKRKHYLGDFSDDDMKSPTKARKMLQIAKNQHKKSSAKIREISRKKKRLEKKICSLQEILQIMKKKCLISHSASNVLEVYFNFSNYFKLVSFCMCPKKGWGGTRIGVLSVPPFEKHCTASF